MSEPLLLDVRTAHDVAGAVLREGPVVVVEPIYGCVAVALALDAGWGCVEIAPEQPEVAPIPLVSYEQAGDASGCCRVRASDLHATLSTVTSLSPGPVLLGSAASARPAAACIARVLDADQARLTIVLVPCEAESNTADAWWAAGMLLRVLLEELDHRDVQLSDPAGVAVTLARGAEDVAAQLSSGVRWRRHLAAGGHEDDLRVASAIDSIAVVPVVHAAADGSLVATPWQPATAAAGPPANRT